MEWIFARQPSLNLLLISSQNQMQWISKYSQGISHILAMMTYHHHTNYTSPTHTSYRSTTCQTRWLRGGSIPSVQLVWVMVVSGSSPSVDGSLGLRMLLLQTLLWMNWVSKWKVFFIIYTVFVSSRTHFMFRCFAVHTHTHIHTHTHTHTHKHTHTHTHTNTHSHTHSHTCTHADACNAKYMYAW